MDPNNPRRQFTIKDTVDTTRINTEDPYFLAVWNSKLIYPSLNIPWRPKAAIVASNKSYHYAMAGASLIHHPSSSTILLTDPICLPEITVQELLRLNPQGKDLPAQLFLVGPIHANIKHQLNCIGFTTLRIGESLNPYEAAVNIASFRLNVIPPMGDTGKVNVIITSGETFAEALAAAGFAAHMGTPILFVQKDHLTAPTEAFIKHHCGKNYFILGSLQTISKQVENEIKALTCGIVERIPGNSAYEIAVNFAKFHKPEAADFGWNRKRPGKGDAFNFAPVHCWENAVMSALQSHEGKHTPELTIMANQLPLVTKAFLEFLRPHKPMPMPPFMHGFIQGGFRDISFEVQIEIEKSIIFQEEDSH